MSQGRWPEVLNLYENVITASEDEYRQLRYTIRLARDAKVVPEDVLSVAIPLLVKLLGSPFSDSDISGQKSIVFCLKCIADRGGNELNVLIGQSGVIPFLLKFLPNSDHCV